jgi:phosphatidylglycerophosphate synthase
MHEPPTEGERWAQAELARLRAARWAPRAVARFLAESRRRAARTRRERAADARRGASWMAFGAVASLLLPLRRPSAEDPVRDGRAGGWLWWVACALMLDWHLGMLETPDGQPVALGAADALTLARAWLVPVVARDAAPVAVVIGALTDLGDGAVARRTRTTRLGRDLEGLVDACFTVAALSGAVRTGRVSRRAALLELARLAAGSGYAVAVYFGAGHAPRRTLSAGGRRAAPLRMAGLVAAGAGRRRLGDRLLYAGTALAVAGALAPRAADRGPR